MEIIAKKKEGEVIHKMMPIRGLFVGSFLLIALLVDVGICYAKDPSPVQIPRILQSLEFGVPAGDGLYPARIAVDSDRQRIYFFNQGNNKEGNTISVFDLRTREFVALVVLNNPGEYVPLTPLDIKVDPYRPRLYAITGDPYAENTEAEMFVLDVNTLTVVKRVSGVEVMEPGPDLLYLASDVQLWSVEPEHLTTQKAVELSYRKFNAPMLLNAPLGRLYLLRSNPSELIVFDSTDLRQLATVSFTAHAEQMVLHQESGQLFVLEVIGEGRAVVHAFDPAGSPLPGSVPIDLSTDPYAYGYPLMTSGGNVLYLGSGPYDAYKISSYRLPDLNLLPGAFTIRRPDKMVVDTKSGLLYALHTSWFGPLVTIDPSQGTVIGITYTALSVRDVLPDPSANRLYVLDDAGSLYVLDLKDYHQINRIETGFSVFPDNWGDYGQMSLDPQRHRLYIDGSPIRVVDTRDLSITVYPDMAGQLAVDPRGNRIYLTPWCRCRMEQCNTLVVDADTMKVTTQLFPPTDPLNAECVTNTHLDPANQLLYASISNGVPGSNSGSYFLIFGVRNAPRLLYRYQDISFGSPAIDPSHRRAYMTRYRLDRSFIHQFEVRDSAVSETRVLAGAGGYLVYDEENGRIFSLSGDTLQVFDDALTLLGEMLLPDRSYRLLDIDTVNQRLYLAGPYDELLVVATSGGDLAAPPPASAVEVSSFAPLQQLLVAPDGTLFRISGERLYRSSDGQYWDLLGKGLPGRPVCALAISPNFAQDRTLFVGLYGYGRAGGLYRSKDGGDTWLPSMRGLTDTEICRLAVSPTFKQDQIVFGASYLRGLFRSDDGGDSWEWLADRYAVEKTDLSVRHIAVSPNFAEDGIILIARDTVFRSSDGGTTWSDTGVPGGLLVFSPNFASDRLVLNNGAWRSEDGGLTWQPSARGLAGNEALSILFSPRFSQDHTVFRLDAQGVLQRSTDSGQSWQSLREELSPEFRPNAFVLLPDGALFVMSLDGRSVVVSPDQLTWETDTVWREEISQLDLQDIVALPDGSLLVANNTAGVLRSTDGGRTWSSGEFPLRGSPSDQALLAAGNGTVFAALGGAIERSGDGGRTWQYLKSVPHGFEVTSLAISPDYLKDGVILAGGRSYLGASIIRSADRGETWQVVFDASQFESTTGMMEVDAVAFSPDFAKSRAVFAWLEYGGLLVSDDGGYSWRLRSEDMTSYAAQSLIVSPDGRQLYLAALYGYVLVSFDQGLSWNDLSSSIPDARVWSSDLLFDDSGVLYLATDVGVYRSRDAGKTWQRASAGLPIDEGTGLPYGVRALAAHGDALYAALRQKGVFASTDQGDTWYSTLTGRPASGP